VQGGIGIHGEARRMTETYGVDATGWGTPFLLVPETGCVDPDLFDLMQNSGVEDLYLSGASPMGVPFNNLRNTTSEKWASKQYVAGRPGSACPKKYLVSNTEFTERPICTASCTYQGKRLGQIASGNGSEDEKKQSSKAILEKTCLCEHLANSALMALGIAKPASIPTVVCPGPNLAWFNRLYTLKEMIDHIYDRGTSLVSAERPHMFAQEFVLSVDQFEQLVVAFDGCPAELKRLEGYKDNLEKEAENCRQIAEAPPYPGENLESIVPCIQLQMERLHRLWKRVLQRNTVQFVDDLKTATLSGPAGESPGISKVTTLGKQAESFSGQPAACV